MTKEEKIKEAYGNYYPQLKDFIDENGWSSNWNHFESVETILFSREDIVKSKGKWRLKSLQGIENNNGYTKIESEKDIPTEEGIFWVLRRGFNKPMYRIINDMFDEEEKIYWLENYTHFLQVTRPDGLPVY